MAPLAGKTNTRTSPAAFAPRAAALGSRASGSQGVFFGGRGVGVGTGKRTGAPDAALGQGNSWLRAWVPAREMTRYARSPIRSMFTQKAGTAASPQASALGALRRRGSAAKGQPGSSYLAEGTPAGPATWAPPAELPLSRAAGGRLWRRRLLSRPSSPCPPPSALDRPGAAASPPRQQPRRQHPAPPPAPPPTRPASG